MREIGVERGQKLTPAQRDALAQRMGPAVPVDVPLLGRAGWIRYNTSDYVDLTFFWGDKRFGPIDLDTLSIPWASD